MNLVYEGSRKIPVTILNESRDYFTTRRQLLMQGLCVVKIFEYQAQRMAFALLNVLSV